jgi:hypothetical protein
LNTKLQCDLLIEGSGTLMVAAGDLPKMFFWERSGIRKPTGPP